MQSAPIPFPKSSNARAHLTSKSLDFWLLGGASILIWAFMFLLDGYDHPYWTVNNHLQNLVLISGSLALVGNYPHFMASYKLAYAQGKDFVFTNWFQLIAVPIGLMGLLAVSYLTYHTQVPSNNLAELNQTLRSVGLDTAIGLQPDIGKELMSLLIQFMFFTVGWHYAKQTYGCMRVMAHYDGYTMSASQWRLIKAGLFSVWMCSFVWANTGPSTADHHGITYASIGLPAWSNGIALSCFVFCFFAAVLTFRGLHKATGQSPSATMLVAPVAFILWWCPPFIQLEYYIWIVPFFHSVQYLAFVYRIEKQQIKGEYPDHGSWAGGVVALGLIAAGFFAFEFVPNRLDQLIGTQQSMGVWFFFAAAALFINVHHYFIDNVIWRFQNPKIRQHLLE